jgi:hypothetical protein
MRFPRSAKPPLGRHLDGCRIGFGLGASGRKRAAAINASVEWMQLSRDRRLASVMESRIRFRYWIWGMRRAA